MGLAALIGVLAGVTLVGGLIALFVGGVRFLVAWAEQWAKWQEHKRWEERQRLEASLPGIVAQSEKLAERLVSSTSSSLNLDDPTEDAA